MKREGMLRNLMQTLLLNKKLSPGVIPRVLALTVLVDVLEIEIES